ILIAVPIAFVLVRPRDEDVVAWPPEPEAQTKVQPTRGDPDAPARRTERAHLWSWLFAAAGFAAIAYGWTTKGPTIDVNTIIWIFLMLGLALHGSPVAYVEAVNNAAKQVGSMILQYPIYGGIMGMLNATGLAGVISKAFV